MDTSDSNPPVGEPLQEPVSEAGLESHAREPQVTGSMNQNLSASLRADFEALQNDFEQANAMSLDLQSQLAGKSNEFAQLKHVFEKTHRNLTQLQTDIAELREERHRLANEAMKVSALEMVLQRTVEDRDQFKAAVEKTTIERDAAIAERNAQATQIATLAAELEAANEKPVGGRQRGGRVSNPRAAVLLSDISRSVEQLRLVMGVQEKEEVPSPFVHAGPGPAPTPKPPTPPPAGDEFIRIAFSP